MKTVPDRTGRFATRPHYEPAELDRECESIITTFLRKKYGEIHFPISTDDLTTFLKRMSPILISMPTSRNSDRASKA